MIYHRLGRDFPHARREALWAAQQRVERGRLRLGLRLLLKDFRAESMVRGADELVGRLAEYRKVLSQAELESMLGLSEREIPRWPIDERAPER